MPGVGDEIRVLLVDDDALVRAGLSMMLDGAGGLVIVGEAGDGDQVPAAVAKHRPHVVLMDLRMPRVDGITATRRLRGVPEPPEVIALTTFDADENVLGALRAGASGFLLKDANAAELVHAVRVVAGGEALLAPSVTRRLIADFARLPRQDQLPTPELDVLTKRETEVLRLIARGLSNGEISDALVIADQTTKTYVGRILAKLNLRDRAQAVVLAYESGLVTPGGS